MIESIPKGGTAVKFHEKLYELRKAAGMTQSDLAEKLDVSRQAVSRWEMGTAMPDVENLLTMSDLFQVSLDYLLKEGSSPGCESAQDIRAAEEKPSQNGGNWLILFILAPLSGLSLLLYGWLFEKDILCSIGVWLLGASLVGVLGLCVVLLICACIRRIKGKKE